MYFAEMGYRVVSERPKRKRAEPGIYDQIRRRKEKRIKTGAYMESVGKWKETNVEPSG